MSPLPPPKGSIVKPPLKILSKGNLPDGDVFVIMSGGNSYAALVLPAEDAAQYNVGDSVEIQLVRP